MYSQDSNEETFGGKRINRDRSPQDIAGVRRTELGNWGNEQ